MLQSPVRYWLGLVAALALVIIGVVLVRPRSSLAPPPAAAAPATANAPSSTSQRDEWAMEGFDPARTRATSAQLTMPLNRMRTLQVKDDTGSGSPVAIARTVMLVEAEHRLRAISLVSGNELWSFPENGRYISPAVAGRTVYIRAEADNAGQVFALDLATGKQRWSFAPPRLSSAATAYWGGHLTSPVIVDGLVYIGAGRELYALDATSGAVRWQYSGADYVSSSAAVGGGRVFISNAKQVLAFDQRTGALAWKHPTSFSVYFAPIVAGQTVYLTSGENILALDTATGTKRWETAIKDATLLPGAIQGSRLFIKSTSTLYALDTATGREVWRFTEPGFVSFPVVAGDKLVLVADSAGRTGVSVLDITTGKRIWHQPLPTLTPAAPIIAGTTVYVRTTDGEVIGLSH